MAGAAQGDRPCRETRVAVLRELSNPSALPQFAAIQTVAPSFGVELSPVSARDAGEIKRGISAFAKFTTGGRPGIGCRRSIRCGSSSPAGA
jgi:hypothetical protein